MPSTTRYTGGINNYDVNWFQNVINDLRNQFVQDGTISAWHMNNLLTLWNVFNDHTHSISDIYGIHDYGDGLGNPGYSGTGSYEYESTYGPSNVSGDVGGVTGDVDVITSGKHNEIRDRLAAGGSHYHGWDDRGA